MVRIYVKSVTITLVFKSGNVAVIGNVPENEVDKIVSEFTTLSHYFVDKNYGLVLE